jgi:hypothetical protein
MLRRFYVAWAVTVALAVIMPIAVPYAIWPPTALVGTSNDCAGRAIIATRTGTHFTAALLPLSADVHSCERAIVYRAEVTARGPYGIPIGSSLVSRSDIQALTANEEGLLLAFAALMAGVVAVSLPFGVVLLQRYFRVMRPASVA